MSIEHLIGRQNPDGGWPYLRGKSWTEPTSYAVMALLASGEREHAGRGIQWLQRLQKKDGGWAPQDGIEESTWVTALPAMLPAALLGDDRHRRSVDWLLRTTGQETTTSYRIRQWLLGHGIPEDQEFPGWPWVPGAAAWVGPTSLAIIALEKQQRRQPSARAAQRIGEGRKFLLARMCQEGGWNHGSARPLGYESRPYPETTGMALAALRGVKSPKLDRAIQAARRFLTECRSADALNWLRLGLTAHGQLPPGYCVPREVTYRTVPESSLDLLAAAETKGNFFWN